MSLRSPLLLALVLLTGPGASAQSLQVTTLAGSTSGGGYVDGTGTASRFSAPAGVAFDSAGNIYVSDTRNYVIRRITPAGVVTTVAGKAGSRGAADGIGDAARFDTPVGITIDTSGILYVADWGNHAIRRVTPSGGVTTIAGTLGVPGTADGVGTAARFTFPEGVRADTSGNLYVADSGNDVIRRIDTATNVTTVAGVKRASGHRDGAAQQALFDYPVSVAVGAGGILYVSDSANHVIRKIEAGTVSTMAGSPGNAGAVDGTGSAARFSRPWGLVADGAGNVFITDSNNDCIRRVTSAGVVSIVAGSLQFWGNSDGSGTAARFHQPLGIAMDAIGNIAVADAWNEAIRFVTPSFGVSTLAGSVPRWGTTDAVGTAARIYYPGTPAVDAAGNVFFTDSNSTIRRISPDGTVTTIAGRAGSEGTADGPASDARFNTPEALALDANGNLYIADTYNHTIRRMTLGGMVTTLAGLGGVPGNQDGAGSAARFREPWGIAVDAAGTVYVADTDNHVIRRISPDGTVTTIAGTGSAGSNDGMGRNASFRFPWRLAVDGGGNLFVADLGNETIRKITPAGVVTTVAGSAGLPGTANGTGESARFDSPQGLAVRADGTIFVADTDNHTIRRISPSGTVTTLAGEADAHANVNGSAGEARFFFPNSIAIDAQGRLIVAETLNHSIRLLTFDPPAAQINATPSLIVAGEPVTLTWSASNAASVSIDQGIGAVAASGSRIVNPQSSTTYRLTATGDGGSATASTNVVLASHATRVRGARSPVVTPTVTVATIAGSTGGGGYADGPAATARFSGVLGAVFDASGALIVADSANNVIRRISGGQVTTLAGKAGSRGRADGSGEEARFDDPEGLAVDRNGNVYVADAGNDAIRRITPSGVVTTFAGALGQSGTADGPASAARFNGPTGLGFDSAGNLYVAECSNSAIRKIDPSGNVTTLAGTKGTDGSRDGTGAEARFNCPLGLAVDSSGTVWVNDYFNHTVRRISPAGDVTTAAGVAGTRGSADGVGNAAKFDGPWGLAVAGDGSVVIADQGNSTIRRVTPAGQVTTIAGASQQAAYADGPATNARFQYPAAVAIDTGGNIAIADANDAIRLLSPSAVVSTFAGSAPQSGSSDGVGTSARFRKPWGVTVDGAGNIYVADDDNSTVRKISPAGIVTTLAGTAGSPGFANGQGSSARFHRPSGVAVDVSGNVYVADLLNNVIRRISPGGVVSTLAGSGALGLQDGPGSQARFNLPYDVAVDSNGVVYVADTHNHAIRRIAVDGTVTTLAGSGTAGSNDGTRGNASFRFPSGIAVDAAGNVFVADYDNATIRKITPAGVVTTVTGVPGVYGVRDGPKSQARLNSPVDVVVAADGTIYVAEYYLNAVRQVTPNGYVTTFAGTSRNRGNVNGSGTAARFNFPSSLAVDATGRIIVSDTDNHAIRSITFDR